jgi:biopolymer transport protein ExbD
MMGTRVCPGRSNRSSGHQVEPTMRMAPAPDELADLGSGPIFVDINITPLTDVFLVLLVIFMVGAIAANVERCVDKPKPPTVGIAVKSPSDRQHDIDPTQASLVLEFPSEGGVYIGGKSFTDDDLDRVLRAAARRSPTQIVVRADCGIQLDRVIQVMERARALGLSHIVIGNRGEAPLALAERGLVAAETVETSPGARRSPDR